MIYLKTYLFTPRLPIIINGFDLIALGSEHGKKTIVNSTKLRGSTVVSAGVGEDISFDIELINAFETKVFLVDPTMKAMSHFENVIANLGVEGSQIYTATGTQDIQSYDLLRVKRSHLNFIPMALWEEDGLIEIFAPLDASHSSFSVHDLQRSGVGLKVGSCTMESLLKNHNIAIPSMVKLDIEGSGLEVCKKMFADQIFPNQIVIEIEELSYPSFKNMLRAKTLFKLFKEFEYVCVNRSTSDFTFVHQSMPTK